MGIVAARKEDGDKSPSDNGIMISIEHFEECHEDGNITDSTLSWVM